MKRLKITLSGTDDRGDGEADLEPVWPQCPDRCGGDVDMTLDGGINKMPECEVWECSDCEGEWDGFGQSILI